MAKISKQELNRKFIEQIKMMESSKIGFFKDGNYEAYRVATALRKLLHDTRNSLSVLSQMEIKERMQFYDVANLIEPDNYIMEKYSLIRYSFNKNPPIIFREITNETPTKCFDEWWNKIVISDGNVNQNTYFTRKDIVLYLADKEGGAHVDPNYDKEKDVAYYNSTRSYQLGKSGSFFNNIKTGELISLNELGFLYSIIAISFEVIATLLDIIPELRQMQVTKGVNYDPPATNIIEDFSFTLTD